MHKVQAQKNGAGFEITRTEVLAFDAPGLQNRQAQLQAEIQSYEAQIAFLTDKMSRAQDELAQVLLLFPVI